MYRGVLVLLVCISLNSQAHSSFSTTISNGSYRVKSYIFCFTFALSSNIYKCWSILSLQQTYLPRCRTSVSLYYWLLKSLFRVQKMRCLQLPYNFLTYSYVSSGTRRIVCSRNSQMASSLSQIHVLIKQYPDSFKQRTIYRPRKSLGFYSSSEPEIKEIIDDSPALASHRSAHLFGLFLVSGRVSLK